MVYHSSRRRYVRSLSAAALGLSLAGCSSGDAGGVTTVDMTDDFSFEPATLTVGAGDTVTWDNVGTVGHSVTAYQDRIPAEASYFASGGFEAESSARNAYPDGRIIGGASYEHTFEAVGSYPYFCVPHERAGMTGTVDVTED